MNLGRRFVMGSVYLGVGNLGANAANLVMQLAIARLLGPEEFGIYAFCFAINEFLNIVGAFSISFALIQAKQVEQEDFDTAFVICAALGLLGLLVAALIAPILWHTHSAEAAGILLVMALARILRLLWQVPEAMLERGIRYAAVTVITTVVAVLPNVVAVGLAWLGWGAWCLAARDVLMTAMLLASSIVWSGYRFRRRLSRASWDKLMGFARPMFVSRGIEIVMERLDSLAVGVFFGIRAAGLYHQARFLSETGFIATKPVERVSFNLYARVQDDPARLARSWELVNYFLIRAMLAGSAVLLVFPEQVVRILLGEEWLEVAPLLRWLGLYAGLFPVFHNVKNLLYGVGQVGRMVRVRVVQVVLFGVAVAVASWLQSITAMAAGLLATTLVAFALAWTAALDLVGRPRTSLLGVPLAMLAASALGLLLLEQAGALHAVPWFLLPVLPALVYTAGIVAVEPVRLRRELRYLVAQARNG